MTYSDFDCPVCKGIGERPGGRIWRRGQTNRHTKKCRRCRGTGVI
jgi:hypothetical protein